VAHKCILCTCVWKRLARLRIGSSDRFLWPRWRVVRFCERRGNFWLAEQLSAPPTQPCSMQLIYLEVYSLIYSMLIV
jgi:hypothetical protein